MMGMWVEDDVRLAVIGRRLSKVKHVVPVMSSKGGVGKTLISSMLALALNDLGFKVGLLDLDVTNPTAHVALGVDVGGELPEEDKGVVPPMVGGVKFMSVAYYSRENPLPLRGWEVENVIREVLAVTVWGELDYLIIDTPPGIRDEALDVLKYFRGCKPVIVTTPSPLTLASVRRLARLISEALGNGYVIENMGGGRPSDAVAGLAKEFRLRYLGVVRFDGSVDSAVGDLSRLKDTVMYADVAGVAERLAEDLNRGSSGGRELSSRYHTYVFKGP